MGYVLNVLILTFVISGVFSKDLHFKENDVARGTENKQIHTYFNVYNQDFNEVDLTKVKDNEPNEANWWGLTDDKYHYNRDRFARHVEVATEKTLKGLLKKAKKNVKNKRHKSVLDKVIQRLKKDLDLKRKQIKNKAPRRKSKTQHTKTTVKNKTSIKV